MAHRIAARTLAAPLLAAALLAAPPVVPPAAAQAPTGVAPEEVVAALLQLGAADVQSTVGEEGGPEIDGTIDGLRFGVIFYRCEGAGQVRCLQVQFRSSFAPDGARALALEKVDEWNRTWVFGKAYLDEENAFFFEHAYYASGGVTKMNIIENAALWLEMLPDFARHVGFR